MTKKCPRCNNSFECSHDSNCWCSRYAISHDVRIYLKNNFSDCLCEDCIKAIIEGSK